VTSASTLTVDQALRQATEAHRAGRLQEAERLYRAILGVQPSHLEANHNIGVLAVGVGRAADALPHFEAALRTGPTQERVWLNYVTALASIGRVAMARVSVQRARSLGVRSQDLDALESKLPRTPTETEGNALIAAHQAASYADMERIGRELTLAYPDSWLGWKALGFALAKTARLAEAVAPLQRSLELRGDDVETCLYLSGAYSGLGRTDLAEALYRRVIELRPDYTEAHVRLGNLLFANERFAEAEAAYRQVTGLTPDVAAAHTNLGVTLCRLERFEEGETVLRRALALAPDTADIHYNLGNLYRDADRLEESETAYRAALAIDPDHTKAINNLAESLSELGKGNDGLELYRGALAKRPDDAGFRWNRSLLDLRLGNFDEGWRGYEWRWRYKGFTTARRDLPKPLWLGDEPVDGKVIAVHWEQGLGDTIQFCRYLPMLEARGAEVVFAPQAPLLALMRTLPGSRRLVDLADIVDQKVAYDCHVPLMSLPLAFRTGHATIPGAVPYLSAEPERIARWRERIGAEGFRIGICWQGRAGKIDLGRSFPVTRFAGIARLPGVRLISLHKGEGLAQLAHLPDGMQVESPGEEFDAGPDAFLDAAAVIMQCDLVISSDTAIAHLAGALGVPTWVALRSSPEWRWMLGATHSPWYPGMRLFRQTSRGNWAPVFEAMEAELKANPVRGRRARS